MYEPGHLNDLQDDAGFGGDPKSWLSGEHLSSSPTLHRTLSSLSNATTNGTAGNVDRVLFNDLVEIVPLVQSLIDRKANSSFTRRGSVIYTKTPSRESLSKKTIEAKGRNVTQSIPTKKRRDFGERDQGNGDSNQDGCADSFSILCSKGLPTEKDTEELVALREQVENLERKVLEKDELLKLTEISKNHLNSMEAKLDELKKQAAEKDSLLKSSQLQLSDAKIKLADKQAALEKLQWETITSNGKVEKLQEDLYNMKEEISSFMLLFEGLTKSETTIGAKDYDVKPYHSDHLPHIDDLDEIEIQKMEAAREAYISAVAAVKEKQDEESLTAAARARICSILGPDELWGDYSNYKVVA
ncbi:unnamed protein product [Ilex paraguariensis]|uniref:Movement protein binding protein 2C n=1 Tax=Ilex paraguariensis TaxID=185542 RepID=A0ABC8RSV3_9AQUA